MWAKEYLSQLKILDLKITHTIEEIDHLKGLALGRGIAYDKDHVQTSPQNAQEDLIAKWIDLERQLDKQIDEYTRQRNKIIMQIYLLDDSRYIKILHDHYVPDAAGEVKSLEQISEEIGYSYDHVRRMHRSALRVLGGMLPHNATIGSGNIVV